MTAGSLVNGAINFRDVGGLPAGTERTRGGVLFRSGHLGNLADDGRQEIAALGIARIIDLRDDDEWDRDGSRAGDIPVQRIPLFLGSVASFFTNDQGLSEMYRSLVDESAERVVTAVRSILETQPVLVHCTVGKDRTGITVALALAAAGVDEKAVVSDYARTAGLLPEERNITVRARLAALYPDMKNLEELTMLSPAPVMQGFLADVTARFGSAADYLRAQGMSDDEVRGLADVLIARSSSTIL